MPPQDTSLPGWLQGSPAVQTLARTLLARYPAAFRAEGALALTATSSRR